MSTSSSKRIGNEEWTSIGLIKDTKFPERYKKRYAKILLYKILIEATGGVIDIDGFKFNIEFQTRNGSSRYLNENVFETLEIKNKELFDKLLILYTKKMYEFIMRSNLKDIDYVYYEGNKTYIIDFILSSIWNMLLIWIYKIL